jgi:hypothetical protein
MPTLPYVPNTREESNRVESEKDSASYHNIHAKQPTTAASTAETAKAAR